MLLLALRRPPRREVMVPSMCNNERRAGRTLRKQCINLHNNSPATTNNFQCHCSQRTWKNTSYLPSTDAAQARNLLHHAAKTTRARAMDTTALTLTMGAATTTDSPLARSADHSKIKKDQARLARSADHKNQPKLQCHPSRSGTRAIC